MRAITVLIISLLAIQTHGASKATLVDAKGATITLDAAILRSANGDKIYRCQEVKPALSKSGTSISFKVVK